MTKASTYTQLRYHSGKSNKFYAIWTIQTDDDKHLLVLNWGRISGGLPTTGQFLVKHKGKYDVSGEAQEKYYEKLDKGYRVHTSGTNVALDPDVVDAVYSHTGFTLDCAIDGARDDGTPTVATPRSEPATQAPSDVFERFSAEIDRLMALDAPTAEAIVAYQELGEQLASLQARVEIAQAQYEIVTDTLLAEFV